MNYGYISKSEARKERLQKWKRIALWIGVPIFTVLQFFQSIFWCFILVHFMQFCLFIFLSIYIIFTGTIKGRGPLRHGKIFITKALLLACAVWILSFYIPEGKYYLYDIKPYLLGDERTIKGKAIIVDHEVTRGMDSQTIHIMGSSFDNRQLINTEKYSGEKLKLYYLPNSGYVLDILAFNEDSEEFRSIIN